MIFEKQNRSNQVFKYNIIFDKKTPQIKEKNTNFLNLEVGVVQLRTES